MSSCRHIMKNIFESCVAVLTLSLFVSCDGYYNYNDSDHDESYPALFKENFIDGYSALLLEDGYELLIDSKSPCVRKLCMARYDFVEDAWTRDGFCSVELDSLGRVNTVYLDGEVLMFSNYSDDTVDLIHIVGDDYQTLENVAYMSDVSKCTSTKSLHKATDSKYLDSVVKIITGTKTSFELAASLVRNPLSIKSALMTILKFTGVVSDGLTGVTIDAVTSGWECAFEENSPSLLEAELLLIEAGKALSQKLTETLIGNWDVKIVAARQTSPRTANIQYSISGVKPDPSVRLSGIVSYKNKSEHTQYLSVPIDVRNGTYSLDIPLESPGRYDIYIYLNAEWGFFVRDRASLCVGYLALSDMSCDYDTYHYNDGYVYYEMSAYMRGENLNDIEEVGIYFRDTRINEINEFPSHDSSVSDGKTRIQFTMLLDKDDFEEKNISTYVAKSKVYKFGPYAKTKDNAKLFFEEIPFEFIYNEKPSISFISARIDDTEVIEQYADSVRYKTSYSFEYTALGCLWLDKIQYEIAQDGWNNGWEEQRTLYDGNYSASGYAEYYNNGYSDLYMRCYYKMYLNGGGILYSDNSLFFRGNPISTITVGAKYGTKAGNYASEACRKGLMCNKWCLAN